MRFFIRDHGETEEDAREVPLSQTDTPILLDEVAEIAAQYHHDHECGWGSSWPLGFSIVSDDGTIQDFEVGREEIPAFHATELRKR